VFHLLKSADALVLGDGPLAIDTEFHTEGTYLPRLHLIQVRANGHDAQLIDPHDDALLREVAPRLLSRPWIVHAGEHDLPILLRALGGIPDTVWDTQIAAGLVETHYPAGLAWLLHRWCGVDLEKAETLSDWSRRPLTPAQQRYAALDVLHLHDLWDRLAEAAEALDRTALVETACRAERERAITPADEGTLWTRLPGAHSLDGVASSALQELAIWREREAAATDRPPHTILNSRILVDLAKRRPADAKSLLSGRRAPKRVLRAHADALLGAIRRAERRPAFAHQDPVRPGTPLHARWAWWCALAEVDALRGSWAARLVLPQQDTRALARGIRPDLGWREALVGTSIDAARHGGRTIDLPSAARSGS
jgi:ribonuclease D